MREILTKWMFVLLALLAAAAAQAQVSWPTRQWETATPESQGMDSRALQALVEYGGYNQMDSLLVTRHGRIVLETYYAPFGPDNLHTINSATKGVVAGLVGIAVAQGVLPGAQLPLVDLFPQYKVADGDDPRKRAVTLQHLLDMTSGLDWNEPLSSAVPVSALEMGRSRNWTRFVAERPMAHAPGTVFNYSSGNSHLASAVLGAAAGMPAEAFAERHLFQPLGIRDWRWRKDPSGVSTGGWGLYLRTRDMAKIGLLYLRRGDWEGRQVIPRDWVEKVYRPVVRMDISRGVEYRYADSWWSIPSRGVYMAVGFHRQLIVVLPEHGVVAAMTGRRNYPIEQMLDHLQAAVKSSSPLAADDAAHAALQARVRLAATEPADRSLPPGPVTPGVSGRTWKASRNELGLKEMTLRLEDSPQLELVSFTEPGSSSTRKVVYRLGADGSSARGDSPRGPVLGRANWMADGSLLVQLRFIEEGETGSYRLRFDGSKAAVEYEYSVGFKTRFALQSE